MPRQKGIDKDNHDSVHQRRIWLGWAFCQPLQLLKQLEVESGASGVFGQQVHGKRLASGVATGESKVELQVAFYGSQLSVATG